MSNTGALGALEVEEEVGWAENEDTFADTRLPILGVLDLSGLKQDRIPSERLQQTMQGGSPHILGPMDGAFKFRMHLAGHGLPTSGAMTAGKIETFLESVFGKLTVGPAGTTFTTGGTSTVPTTTASDTFPDGGLCVAGELGDGRGNGQFAEIATHVANALTLLTPLDGAPVNDDVCHSVVHLYLPESPSDEANDIVGLRFRALTADKRYRMRGCFITSVSVGGANTSETPWIEFDFGVSYWDSTDSGTFPSPVESEQYNPAPVAAGSFFLQAVDTATRQLLEIRNFALTITLGISPRKGPGGVWPHQTTTGAKRTPSRIQVSVTYDVDDAVDAEAIFLVGSRWRMLYTLSTTPGSRVAFLARNLCITGSRPVQVVGADGIHQWSLTADAYTGGTATSALTQAAFVVGLA